MADPDLHQHVEQYENGAIKARFSLKNGSCTARIS